MIKLLPILLISAMAGVGGFSAGSLNNVQADPNVTTENHATVRIQQGADQNSSANLFLSADGKYSL